MTFVRFDPAKSAKAFDCRFLFVLRFVFSFNRGGDRTAAVGKQKTVLALPGALFLGLFELHRHNAGKSEAFARDAFCILAQIKRANGIGAAGIVRLRGAPPFPQNEALSPTYGKRIRSAGICGYGRRCRRQGSGAYRSHSFVSDISGNSFGLHLPFRFVLQA